MRVAPTRGERVALLLSKMGAAMIYRRSAVAVVASAAVLVSIFTLLEISYRQQVSQDTKVSDAEDPTLAFTGTLPSSPPDRPVKFQLASAQWVPLSPPGALLIPAATIELIQTSQARGVSRQPVPLPRSRPKR